MLEWKPGVAGGETATTPLCSIDVFLLTGRKKHYAARIYGYSRQLLARADNLPTLDDAKAWCEQAYAELLSAELARVGPPGPTVSELRELLRCVLIDSDLSHSRAISYDTKIKIERALAAD